MQKIPTLFERDWTGDRSRVLNRVTSGCDWVIAGDGIATRKLDGTCCLIRGGRLYKRRELKKGETPPQYFEEVSHDPETEKTVGWLPVDDGPGDKWHREAFGLRDDWMDGTYELIGPKVQGNPERKDEHVLIKHGEGIAGIIADVPRSFDGLKSWFVNQDIEGVVFHHPDGRMAKIKKRDFGLKR